jgi:MFS family permease
VVGLPLLAHATTENPLAISLVAAASTVPWVFGIVFGTFADRHDARRVMIGCDVVRAVLLSVLGLWLLIAQGKVPIVGLVLLALVLSAGQITGSAATQRALPAVAGETAQQITAANSQFSTVTSLGEQFIGPQIGSVLLTGGTVPILGDALSFIGSAVLLRGLPSIPGDKDRSVLAGLTAGWKWFRSSRLLKLQVAVVTINAAASKAVVGLEIVIARDTLRIPLWAFGLFTAVLAGAALIASVLAPRIIKRLGSKTISVSTIVGGLSYIACIRLRSVPLMFAALCLQQAATVVGIINVASLRQQIVPDHLRGRVITLARSITYTIAVAGIVIGGWVAQRFGTDGLFAAAGFSTLIVGILFARPLQRATVAATSQNQ